LSQAQSFSMILLKMYAILSFISFSWIDSRHNHSSKQNLSMLSFKVQIRRLIPSLDSALFLYCQKYSQDQQVYSFKLKTSLETSFCFVLLAALQQTHFKLIEHMQYVQDDISSPWIQLLILKEKALSFLCFL